MRATSRRRLGAALLALAVLAVPAAHAAPAAGAGAIELSAAFDRAARLGGTTPLTVDLRLDPDRMPIAPLSEVRFEYPRTLGVVSSGLGLAACTRPASDFAAVLISASGLAGCPGNAVMGYGTARALVRLVDGQEIDEFATVTLLSGAIERGRLGLVVYVDGVRPFGAKLAFAGDVRPAGGAYGGALAVRMPVVPGIEDLAVISLVQLRIAIGSPAIRYRERRGGRMVSYRPDGIALPSTCPRGGGFPFRARVSFRDGTVQTATTTTPCPPSPLVARSGGR